MVAGCCCVSVLIEGLFKLPRPQINLHQFFILHFPGIGTVGMHYHNKPDVNFFKAIKGSYKKPSPATYLL